MARFVRIEKDIKKIVGDQKALGEYVDQVTSELRLSRSDGSSEWVVLCSEGFLNLRMKKAV